MNPSPYSLHIKRGDKVRIEYPKLNGRARSPHRKDGLYTVIKADNTRGIYHIQNPEKITIAKRDYIKDVSPGVFT